MKGIWDSVAKCQIGKVKASPTSAVKLTAAGTMKVIDQWLKERPEFIESEHNSKQIALMLKADHGTASPRDTAAIDAAVEKLLRINALQLVAGKGPEQMTEDERYIASQRLLQTSGRAHSTPTPEPTAPSEEENTGKGL